MSSYADGVWSHPNNCPTCWAMRVSQGFKLPETTGEECDSCKHATALIAFYSSAKYVAWQSSIPEGMAMEEMAAWFADHPEPSFLDIGKL
jgi:hypothetical protein